LLGISKVVEVKTPEQFEQVLSESSKVIVDFWATWCGPCKRLAPHYEAAAERSDATFVKVDIEAVPTLTTDFNIQSVPTVLGFKDGLLTATIESRTAIPLLREVEAL
jgi:thioredoxin